MKLGLKAAYSQLSQEGTITKITWSTVVVYLLFCVIYIIFHFGPAPIPQGAVLPKVVPLSHWDTNVEQLRGRFENTPAEITIVKVAFESREEGLRFCEQNYSEYHNTGKCLPKLARGFHDPIYCELDGGRDDIDFRNCVLGVSTVVGQYDCRIHSTAIFQDDCFYEFGSQNVYNNPRTINDGLVCANIINKYKRDSCLNWFSSKPLIGMAIIDLVIFLLVLFGALTLRRWSGYMLIGYIALILLLSMNPIYPLLWDGGLLDTFEMLTGQASAGDMINLLLVILSGSTLIIITRRINGTKSGPKNIENVIELPTEPIKNI